jgi:hypothetical protein
LEGEHQDHGLKSGPGLRDVVTVYEGREVPKA